VPNNKKNYAKIAIPSSLNQILVENDQKTKLGEGIRWASAMDEMGDDNDDRHSFR